MKTRNALIIGAVILIAVYAVASWTSTSVSSSGQFSRLEDGTILYTHHLSNLTWHPIRYTVASDPKSPVTATLIRWDSSEPERTTASMEPGNDTAPWSASMSVPGHQDASIEVALKIDEGVSSQGLTVNSDFSGFYPSVTILLKVND